MSIFRHQGEKSKSFYRSNGVFVNWILFYEHCRIITFPHARKSIKFFFKLHFVTRGLIRIKVHHHSSTNCFASLHHTYGVTKQISFTFAPHYTIRKLSCRLLPCHCSVIFYNLKKNKTQWNQIACIREWHVFRSYADDMTWWAHFYNVELCDEFVTIIWTVITEMDS